MNRIVRRIKDYRNRYRYGWKVCSLMLDGKLTGVALNTHTYGIGIITRRGDSGPLCVYIHKWQARLALGLWGRKDTHLYRCRYRKSNLDRLWTEANLMGSTPKNELPWGIALAEEVELLWEVK